MSESNWDERAVFLEALALPKERRDEYLDSACPDASARARIETLLHHHDAASDDFLEISVKPAEEHSSQPTQIDEFKILHRLGAGGMGVVYLAEDTILGRHVALKVLARHMIGSEQALARFREEARSAAALKHPAIVPVFKSGRDKDDYYLVSEFVEGHTLAELINQTRTTRTSAGTSDLRAWYRRAAEIVAIVADALDCAHRAKIVHRDVKPSNILIDKDRGPRLTDFGIAKHLVEENRTRETGLVGSCHYMSPEQADIAEKQVDQRSDIFSLGVVLYEMLALRLPFDGNNLHQVLKAVVECNPPKLRTIDRNIPADLETICHKALEKLPRDRYQTAAHIAADLRCYLAGDPILARPPTRTRKIARWLRLHRTLTMAAMILLLFGTVAGLVVRDLSRQTAAMCPIAVDSIPHGARVLAQLVTESPVSIVKPIELGFTPFGIRRLPPGEYRLTALLNGTQFAEATVYLYDPRKLNSISVSFNDRSPSFFKDMVRVNTDAVVEGINGSARLASYWIDKYEVSQAQYRAFLNATAYEAPVDKDHPICDVGLDKRPIVGITWEDAQAYARWAGKRLPTALEWEYAARYPDARRLPWGNSSTVAPPSVSILSIAEAQSAQWSLGLKAFRENTLPVDSDVRPSQLGLHYTFGNVREFTDTVTGSPVQCVVVKEGTWYDVPGIRDLRNRIYQPIESRSLIVGFRCATSAEVSY